MPLTRENILKALTTVADPWSKSDVVSAGRISGVTVKDGKAGFLIDMPKGTEAQAERLRAACEAAVSALPGILSVTAVPTAHQAPSMPAVPAPVEGVKRLIAVASGKGGVGKSTSAVQLAQAFMRLGKRAGLLDADIYGPSMPRMLGLMGAGQPEIEGGKMLPPVARGISCMSVEFLFQGQAAVLRGPIISKTLSQLLRATRWQQGGAPLDMLLVDMPPGTGDVLLSLAQNAPLDGALIVTTPQDVAVADARKAAVAFQKLRVPILGIIENMSWFEAGGTRHALFGEGGGAALAREFGVPLLAQVPLEPSLREAGDRGMAADQGIAADAYQKAAMNILKAMH